MLEGAPATVEACAPDVGQATVERLSKDSSYQSRTSNKISRTLCVDNRPMYDNEDLKVIQSTVE